MQGMRYAMGRDGQGMSTEKQCVQDRTDMMMGMPCLSVTLLLSLYFSMGLHNAIQH